MRILLLFPPVTSTRHNEAHQRTPVAPPLGLAYIASSAEHAGHEVKIVDCLLEGFDRSINIGTDQVRYGLSDDEIAEIVAKYEPDIIGINCIFSNLHRSVCNLTLLCKKTLPGARIVIGGGNATIMPEKMLRDSGADFVVIGEGEESFVDLLASLEKGNPALTEIDGLSYLKNGEVIVQPKTRYIADLDTIPFPAWHLLNAKKYNELLLPHGDYRRTPYAPVVTSRACPARCTFCASKSIWGTIYRARSAENVLAEIRMLIRDFGVKEIHFEDDNLTLDKKRAMAIFNGIVEEKLDLTWTSPNGLAVFTLDEELIMKMKESGGFSFALAIESGDQWVLTNLIKKPLKLDRVKETVRIMRKHSLRTKGFFMLGFPGESKETMARSLAFAESLGLDWVAFTIATPLPGSDLYATCVEKGYFDSDNLNMDDMKFGMVQINTQKFTAEEVRAISSEANVRINFTDNYNMKTGCYDRAIVDFERVARLYPDHILARLCLGDAYRLTGRCDEAKPQWERVLEIDPDNADAKERLSDLAKDRP